MFMTRVVGVLLASSLALAGSAGAEETTITTEKRTIRCLPIRPGPATTEVTPPISEEMVPPGEEVPALKAEQPMISETTPPSLEEPGLDEKEAELPVEERAQVKGADEALADEETEGESCPQLS